MTTASERFGWGEPAANGGGQGATGAPDFARPDRGEADDHWSRAVGQACRKCGVELTAKDYVRRRLDGTWVHENNCPRPASDEADDAATDETVDEDR